MSDPYHTQAEVSPEIQTNAFQVKFPSRAVLYFRPIGAKEMSAIGKMNSSAPEKLFSLLHACHVSTVDPGPYKTVVIGDETSKPNWSRVPWGDVFYGVVALYKGSFRRKLSDDDSKQDLVEFEGVDTKTLAVGDVVNFDYTCLHCGKMRPWKVLTDDILANHTPISDEVFDRIESGKDLVMRLGGKDIYWMPPTQARDVPFIKQMEKDGQVEETVVEMLAKHITHIPSIGDRVQKPREFLMFCQSLSMDSVDELLEQIDKANWGLNSIIPITCDACGREQAQTIPFGAIFASRRQTMSTLLKRMQAKT